MSYFNPKIYNYSNLHKEDKNKVWIIKNFFIETLDGLLETELEDCTTIQKMEAEIRNEAIEDAKELLKGELIEYMVSLIDSYFENEEVNKKDTDDYFYGLED